MTDTTPSPEPEDGRDPLEEAASIIDGEAARAEAESASADPEADELDSDLARAEARAAEAFADLQRLQAEFVNYRKRVERDRAAAGEQATSKVVEALIPVLDDLAGAREHGDLETDGPFKSIASKLEETLGRLGWSSFGAPGEEFDPQLHEALMSQPSQDVTVPTIQHVAQPGHRIGDRVVRPARVIVSQPE